MQSVRPAFFWVENQARASLCRERPRIAFVELPDVGMSNLSTNALRGLRAGRGLLSRPSSRPGDRLGTTVFYRIGL